MKWTLLADWVCDVGNNVGRDSEEEILSDGTSEDSSTEERDSGALRQARIYNIHHIFVKNTETIQNNFVKYSRVRTLIGVGLLEFGFVPFLLVN